MLLVSAVILQQTVPHHTPQERLVIATVGRSEAASEHDQSSVKAVQRSWFVAKRALDPFLR